MGVVTLCLEHRPPSATNLAYSEFSKLVFKDVVCEWFK